MKKLIALATVAMMPSFASAGLITFDNVAGKTASPYIESGYKFELIGGNPVATESHFGDGLDTDGILDWHDEAVVTGDGNPGNAILRMTKVDGGLFDLLGFDLLAESLNGIWLEGYVDGSRTQQISVNKGSYAPSLMGIHEARIDFRYSGPNYGGIDNVSVTSVPESGSLALLGLGLTGLGLSLRKKG